MDHTSAEERAKELRETHPDRLTHTWMARGTPDGEWEVVKVRRPGGQAGGASPPPPPDVRDVPPSGGAA